MTRFMIRVALRAASWLVIPLAVLLFAQWPLRDGLHAGSLLANDMGQIVFALFMSCAVTAASRRGTHLCAGLRTPWPPKVRSWAVLACVTPWAVFVMWTAAPQVGRSLAAFERFSETLHPGYFLIKLAMWWLVALTLTDAVLALRTRPADA